MKNQMMNDIHLTLTAEGVEDVDRIMRALIIALDKYSVDIKSGEIVLYDKADNEALIQRFIVEKMVKGCTERTISYYISTLRRWCISIKNKCFTDIEADDIKLIVAKRMLNDKVTATTINNELRVLSSFYTWLHNEGLVEKNVMSKVEMVKVKKVKKEAFSDMEIEMIRNACRDEREKMIVEVLLSTGCRVSEFTSIKTNDININKVKVVGKGRKERIVYMNAKAQVAIQNWQSLRVDDNPFLLPASIMINGGSENLNQVRGKWWLDKALVSKDKAMDKSTVEQITRTIGKRAGVKNCHPHRFRRTCATNELRNGMPLVHVSKMLGHESLETTQIYLDIDQRELELSHERYARG